MIDFKWLPTFKEEHSNIEIITFSEIFNQPLGNSLDNLVNLQTLKLNDNYFLEDINQKGLTKKLIKVLLEIKSEKILYISCNPSTQARDLEILSCEYEVTLSQAIDMFPQTYHVENVVLLEKI